MNELLREVTRNGKEVSSVKFGSQNQYCSILLSSYLFNLVFFMLAISMNIL